MLRHLNIFLFCSQYLISLASYRLKSRKFDTHRAICSAEKFFPNRSNPSSLGSSELCYCDVYRAAQHVMMHFCIVIWLPPRPWREGRDISAEQRRLCETLDSSDVVYVRMCVLLFSLWSLHWSSHLGGWTCLWYANSCFDRKKRVETQKNANFYSDRSWKHRKWSSTKLNGKCEV